MLEKLSLRKRVMVLAGAVLGMTLVAGIGVFAVQQASGKAAHGAIAATAAPTPAAASRTPVANPLSCNAAGSQPVVKLKGHALPLCK